MSSFGWLFVLVLVLGFYRTHRMKKSSDQKAFLKGKVPSPLPDGLYSGVVKGYGGSWKGKMFDRAKHGGINLFDRNGKDTKKYPFQMYVAKGLQDPKKDVLRIDYAFSANPFWVRPVLDEIVEVAPKKYLGKVHLRIIPGLPFTIAFFRLEK